MAGNTTKLFRTTLIKLGTLKSILRNVAAHHQMHVSRLLELLDL
jgi:hypothetical protein